MIPISNNLQWKLNLATEFSLKPTLCTGIQAEKAINGDIMALPKRPLGYRTDKREHIHGCWNKM